jgi:hypothetical protein
LTFEQIEQRLALSTTPISLTISFSDLDSTGSYLQTMDVASGGNIFVDVVLNGGNSFKDRLTTTAGFIGIDNGEPLFTGPVFSKPEAEGALNSSEAGTSVAPIPQPQLGKGEITEGLIVVADIFRPTNGTMSYGVDESLVENGSVETTVAQTANDSWKSTSLSRGRDVYFEVAALTDDRAANSNRESVNLSSKIAPLIYQQTLERRETERASSTTSQEQSNSSRPLSPLPAVPQQKPQPADIKHSESPVNDANAEENQRTAQDGEVPLADEVSQAVNPHDHVFAIWSGDAELSDEALALRTENQQSHSATWPVLAALAATGWMARNRRSAGILPSHRLPLRRK